MDALDKLFTEQQPVDLDMMFGNTNPLIQPPVTATRNRAATTALLSPDASRSVDNYNMMMAEAKDGNNTTQQTIMEGVKRESGELDMKAVLGILSDPSIPLDKKQGAIDAIKQSKVLKDTGVHLHSKSLAAESKGEPLEQEAARITGASAVAEIYKARSDVQGLVNAHAMSLRSANVQTAAEMAEAWVMPFGNSIFQANVSKKLAAEQGAKFNTWDWAKSFLLPGSSRKDQMEMLAKLPPDKRAEFATKMVKAISNTGVLLSNDNQFAQFDIASNINETGGYGTTAAFLDNASVLLDIVGVGQTIRAGKRIGKLSEGVKTVEQGVDSSSVGKAVEEAVVKPEVYMPYGMPVAVERRTGIYEISQGAPIQKPVKDGKTAQLFQPKMDQEYEQVITEIKRIELNYPVHNVNPASPAEILATTNPEKARTAFEAVVKSEGDDVAEALHGVSKEQAVTNNTFPQVAVPNGSVQTKVIDIDRNLRKELNISDDLVEMVHNTGAIEMTRAEKAAVRSHIQHKFENAEGLHMVPNMGTFDLVGRQVKISATYGLPEGGFLRAEDAYRQAQLATREYGILDDEITILKKEGLNHVPIDKNSFDGAEGHYLVKIDSTQDISMGDVTKLGVAEAFDVKRNWFDRIPQFVSRNKGSVSRWLADPASMLHKNLSGAAVVAEDQVARFDKFMLQMADEYAKKWESFKAPRQAKIDDYLKEANYNGVKFDVTDMVARGFTEKEIDAVRSWRKYWDSHFYLENYDLIRTLNAQGYQLFKNNVTELYAKPIPKNQNLGNVYDPALDTVLVHSKIQGDELYGSGGTYARLRRPVDINGVTVEHMIVRNTPSEYLRKFRDTDQVLNYREGYYQIAYSAPKFVDEAVRGATGKVEYYKAIAVAGDTKEAEFFAQRMASTNGKKLGEDYRVRGDDRAMSRGDDGWWDVNSAAGRIAQRHRGKLLEDGGGLNHLGDGSYIVSPVDSAIKAARSIAGRTVTRPMLETAKSRFMQQYERFLMSDEMGGVKWPANVDQIGAKGEFVTKELADARTTYEYINYLENGYINGMDQATKALFYSISDAAGKAGLSKIERAALAVGDTSITGLAKNSVFSAYLAANPLRQWIVQTHQVVRTAAYNPKGWLDGSIVKLVGEFAASKVSPTKTSEFTKFINDSGLLDAVDKQNLVRGSLLAAADSSNKLLTTAKAPLTFMRRIGFDIGEQGNLLGHAAAVYDKYKREGKNLLDKATRDEAYSEIRAISYDMNFAGDMPYNQTTPALLLQFMQVPHKAMLQATNRRIPLDARMQMIAADLVLWGTPAASIAAFYGMEILPKNETARELVVNGLESVMLNTMFDMMAGDDTRIDFTSLAPYDMTGWGKFASAIWTEGLQTVILNSPAGSLLFKDGSQGKKVIQSLGRWFNAFEDDEETPETFLSVADEVAKMSSGYNNIIKARLLLDMRKRLDQYGNQVDDKVTKYEAWAQALGFGTMDSHNLYKISQERFKSDKAEQEEILKVYKDIRRMYADKLQTEATDPLYIQKVSGRLLQVFKDNPPALALVTRQFTKDMIDKDSALVVKMIKASGGKNAGALKDQVKQLPVDEAEKDRLLNIVDDAQKARQLLENKE